MTVAELIAELGKYPGETKVYINTGEYPHSVPSTQVTLMATEWVSEPKCDVHGFVGPENQRGGPYGVCRLCHPTGERISLDTASMLKMERRAVKLADQELVIEGQHPGDRA